MKLPSVLLVAAATVVSAGYDVASDLPICAQTCFYKVGFEVAPLKGCPGPPLAPPDVACCCSQPEIRKASYDCIAQACPAGEYTEIVEFGERECAKVLGIPIAWPNPEPGLEQPVPGAPIIPTEIPVSITVVVDIPTATVIATSGPSTATLEANTSTFPTPTKTDIIKGAEKTTIAEGGVGMLTASMGVVAAVAAVAGWIAL